MPAAHELTEQQRQRITDILSRPMFFPEEFTKWLPQWLAQNMPVIPVGQISGYQQRRGDFSEHINDAGTEELNPDDAWGTQATPSPKVERLANGSYLCIYGAFFAGGFQASTGQIGISINGSTPDVNFAARADNLLDDGFYVQAAHVFDVQSASGVNTIEAKIKLTDLSGAGTIFWGSRYLITLRAN